MIGRAAFLSLAVLATGPSILPAQSAAASPFLSQDHWVHDAVRRAASGASRPAALAARRTLTACEAAGALRAAADGDGAARDLAGLALARFLEDFPLARPDACGADAFAVSAVAGTVQREGGLLTGTGYGRDGIPRTPPVPARDISSLTAGVRLSAATGPRLAGLVEAGYLAGGWRLESAHGVLTLGPVLVWGGRRGVGYGPGEGGGLVFGDEARVDGGGLQLGVPLVGPGFLRHLGPVHFETLLARGGPSGQVRNPWLWAARGSVRPHDRLVLGINRGALFGGEGNVGTTFRDLLYILIGKHAGGGSALENQIVAVDLLYRPPLPLAPEAYIEWGFEDSAGAWRSVPGVLWGLALGDVPGLTGARVGIERTDFARACCGNPIWYRHMFLHAGWTEEGRPLGHPLGGHGAEWLAFGSAGFLGERLQVRSSLALRDRRSENLYAPERVGRSQAGRLRAVWQAGRWNAGLEVHSEAGRGWVETLLSTTARFRF